MIATRSGVERVGAARRRRSRKRAADRRADVHVGELDDAEAVERRGQAAGAGTSTALDGDRRAPVRPPPPPSRGRRAGDAAEQPGEEQAALGVDHRSGGAKADQRQQPQHLAGQQAGKQKNQKTHP